MPRLRRFVCLGLPSGSPARNRSESFSARHCTLFVLSSQYVLIVESGTVGCLSTTGEAVMPFLSWFFNQFVPNILANIATQGTPQMIGAALAAVILGGVWLFRWHHGRRNKGNRGVEPWHLIVVGLGGVVIFALLAIGGVIWQWQSAPHVAQGSAQPPPQSQTKNDGLLEWDDHLGHTYSGQAPATVTEAIQIGAKNGPEHEIQFEDAYIISGEGFGKARMKVGSARGWILPNEANPIPPNGVIVFRAEFTPTPAREFFDKWKTIYLTVKHDGGLGLRPN